MRTDHESIQQTAFDPVAFKSDGGDLADVLLASRGSNRATGRGGLHLYKVSWNGAVGPKVAWDENTTTIPIVMTVEVVPGGPPA